MTDAPLDQTASRLAQAVIDLATIAVERGMPKQRAIEAVAVALGALVGRCVRDESRSAALDDVCKTVRATAAAVADSDSDEATLNVLISHQVRH